MQRFMIAWPSFPESFSFFHTCARKRLMRPSSRPASSFLFRNAFWRPGLALRQPVLRELVQRVRPVVPVHEIEIRVAGMARHGAPIACVFHAVDDRAVAA